MIRKGGNRQISARTMGIPNYSNAKLSNKDRNSLISAREHLSINQFQTKEHLPCYSHLSLKVNHESARRKKRKSEPIFHLKNQQILNARSTKAKVLSQSLNYSDINPYTKNQYIYQSNAKRIDREKKNRYLKKSLKINSILKPFLIEKVGVQQKTSSSRHNSDINLNKSQAGIDCTKIGLKLELELIKIQENKPRSFSAQRPPRLIKNIKKWEIDEKKLQDKLIFGEQLGSPGPSPWKIEQSPLIF